ncbi:ATP-binding protein [Rhizobium leguminosarum]|uniref:ATP-binding protein n=1 Tax=Rhizobium leguminosarum TaxID=384 RepID=A0A4Q1TKS2_RHILE|nr:ATP-binding protein [Rhizobium leguminosarum]RXT18747.1 ATP-binding protein [Rhizobium leguminosarum]
MARPHHLPPSAACLSASLRDLGYSLETAIADLVDNSISADATFIQIFCDISRADPVVVISDNGKGMNEVEVILAMRHGSTDPKQKRSPKDLGRFGLGLKTASFSQCKRLTVASSQHGERVAAEWDLAKIEDEDDWNMSILDPSEISSLPFIETIDGTGTLVVWRDLDRLFEDETGNKRDEIVNEKIAAVDRHLSLVFHRFLSGDVKGRKKIAILINGHPVAAFDPFCRNNSATQMLPEETVWIGDDAVQMQPYILPHHNRLSASEYDYYQDRSDFISNQGAYIYRNARLMAWGDWFRLVPKGEATKLARVQIDFPNSLDEDWTIDIKKSRARPPHIVRERLRQIIAKITARSVIVHRGRGQKLFQETRAPIWERYADHGGIRFAVNMQHPLVQSLDARLPQEDIRSLHVLLESIGASLPVEMIYSDYSTNPREMVQAALGEKEVIERLKSLRSALFGDGPGDPKAFLQIVRSTRLFDNQMETAEKFTREAFA